MSLLSHILIYLFVLELCNMSVSTAPTTPSTATSLVTPSSVFSSCQLDDSEPTVTTSISGRSNTTQNLHKHLLGGNRKSMRLPILEDEKAESNECVLDEIFDEEDDDFDDEEEELGDEEILNDEDDFRNVADSELNNRSDDGEATDSMAAHSNALSSELEAHNEENGNDDMFTNGNGRMSGCSDENELDEEVASMESHNGQDHDHHNHRHRDRLGGASSFSDDLLNNMVGLFSFSNHQIRKISTLCFKILYRFDKYAFEFCAI